MSPTWLASSVVPGTDRKQSVPEVSRALSSTYLCGVVIVGKPGVGKTHLITEVLKESAMSYLVIHLRGTTLTSDKPFSALSFLMSEFDLSIELEPHVIVESLTFHLEEMASNEQVVMAIDNADALDAASADVVAQLALNRTVKLLIACRDLANCPPSLRTLWLEGALTRVDLEKLPLPEAQALLTETLDGSISRRAIHALWDASSGNPRLMQSLVHDFVGSGRIVRQGDVWVRGRGPLEFSLSTADAVMAHLGPLSDRQTDLLEMLALAGSMPLSLASALGSVQDLDHLHSVGAIELARDSQQLVSIGHLVGAVIRGRVGAFSRVDHLKRLQEAQATLESAAIHPVRQAEWLIECGMPLDPEVGLRAVSLANDHDDPETALRIASHLNDATSSELPLMVETARAHLRSEDHGAAAHAMDRFRAAASGSFSSEELALLESPEHRAVRVQIQVARSLLTSHGYPSAGPLGDFHRKTPGEGEVLLAKVEQAAVEGRYALVVSLLEGKPGQWSIYGPETELQLKGFLALGGAITDRQHEALALTEEIAAGLQNLPLAPKVRGRLVFQVQLVLLITGKSNAVLGGSAHDLPLVSGDGTAGELMDGVGLALHNRHEDALALLTPALAQLYARDPAGLRCVAAAATAYCYALQGDFEKVRPLMVPLAEPATQFSLPHCVLRYFRALTIALQGSTAQAIPMLNEQAEEERQAGRFGIELLARAAAMRLGDEAAVLSLLDVAGRTQGPFSDLYSLVCEGATAKKPQLLLQAGTMAESMGNHQLAAELTESAGAMAEASGDRKVARQVRTVLAGSTSRMAEVSRERQLDQLTPRETEVSRLVKLGYSNKEIAGQMHVSSRTVEGHLYQIYMKLGVSNRSDLLAALDDAAS